MEQERISVEDSKVKIEIDLAGLWVGGEHGSTFAEHVADRAALILLKERDAVPDLRRRVAAVTDEEIREHVRPLVGEALERSFQPTDSFGTPRGEPTTLHAQVVELVKKELTDKRERNGYHRPKTTLVEEFIRAEVQEALGKELQQTVRDAKEQVLAAVRDRAGEVIAETIERVASGRTL